MTATGKSRALVFLVLLACLLAAHAAALAQRIAVLPFAIYSERDANLLRNPIYNRMTHELGTVQTVHIVPSEQFAVRIGGNRFEWKEIERDEELIEMMIAKESEFWRCVETQTPPPISESKAELHGDIMNRLYPNANAGASIELPPTYSDTLEQLVDVKTRIKELEVSQDYLENQIKDAMKDAERARVGRFSVSWKNVTTRRFDNKLFEKTNPDLYTQYTKESQSRRFTVKEETL